MVFSYSFLLFGQNCLCFSCLTDEFYHNSDSYMRDVMTQTACRHVDVIIDRLAECDECKCSVNAYLHQTDGISAFDSTTPWYLNLLFPIGTCEASRFSIRIRIGRPDSNTIRQ